jgi:dipeptide/tripeptide permease
VLRRIALFLLLPGAFALERLAYYGMRSVLSLHLMRNLGATAASMGQIYAAIGIANIFAVLVGGAVCILIRPSIVLLVGSIIGVLGYGLLSISSSVALVWLAILILSMGQGLLKPAAFALAASELPFPHEHLRSALMVLMYGATNLSALAGSSGSGAIAVRTGENVSFALATGFAVVGVLLAAGAAAVDYLVKRDSEPEPGPSAGGVAAGGGILLALALPYYSTMGLAGSYQFEALQRAGATGSMAALYAINPVTVLLTTGVLFVVFLVLHFTRVRVSSLFGIGSGLAIYALGATPLLLVTTFPSSAMLGVGASAVAMAVGESLVGPLLLSRVVGDIPARFAGVAAGVLLAVSYGVSWIADAISRPWPAATGILLSLGVVVCLAVGVLLLAITPMMGRRFYAPPAEGSA